MHDVLRNKFTVLALGVKFVLFVHNTGVGTLETVLDSLLALHHFYSNYLNVVESGFWGFGVLGRRTVVVPSMSS